MPVTLSTLFCAAQDVWDILSVVGVDLREDDDNLASGQIIRVSTDTVVGVLSLPVDSLPVPLLRGAELVFDTIADDPNAALLVSDTFTDTNGMALASHTMDDGSGWTVHIGAVEIQSNKAQRVSGQGISTTNGKQANVAVEADFVGYMPSAGNYSIPALVVRSNSDATNFYEWDLDITTGGGRLLLSRVTAGVYQTINSSVRPLTPGQTYRLRLECWGTTIRGYLDNARVLEADDCNQGVTNTRCGFGFGAGGTSTQATVDNFTVNTYTPTPATGVSSPVIVRLSAAAPISSTSLSIDALGASLIAGSQARDSGVNASTGARLLVGCRKGTSKVKLWCNQRYDDSQLALSGTVCDWASICAAKFLCTRRAQGCPKSIALDYDEVIEELRMVQSGQLAIEDIGTRGSDWPSMTNVTVNPGYDGMRARVQPYISEQTPTAFGQFIDWNSAAALGY